MNLSEPTVEQLSTAEVGLTGLAVIGKVVSLNPISGADFICLAGIDCGLSGLWSGLCPSQPRPMTS